MNLIIQILMRQETKENAPEFKTLLRKINSFNPYKKPTNLNILKAAKKGTGAARRN